MLLPGPVSWRPTPAAHAAEFEIAADSFTVANQVNISSVGYFNTRSAAPANPNTATLLTTPGGLYFDGFYYKVWDRNTSIWVQLATGTVEAGRVAKIGDTMTGQLTLTGAAANVVGQSSITTAGGFFGNGAGIVGVTAANIAAGTAGISVTGNAATATNATTHIADVAGAVHGATNLNTENMIVRRDASGNFRVSDPIGNTDAANKQWVLANAGRVQYMGLAPASTGAMGGPLGANALCGAVYSGSFLCRQSDIVSSGSSGLSAAAWIFPDHIFYAGASWYLGGFSSVIVPTGDACVGYNTSSTSRSGLVIGTSGTLSAVVCDQIYPLACCK